MVNQTLNTAVVPLGTRTLQHIINCIEQHGDTIEASYLEIKSTLDLKTPRAIAKIAKFLLGAANRLPRQAAEHFKGYAVIVVGADQGQAQGVPRDIEPHEVEEKLRQYLGAGFPPFDIERVPVEDGHDVWFFISPPPQDGDGIFPCHKQYTSENKNERKDNLMDGAVYTRNHTQTKPATASHILALVERARGGIISPADLDIALLGTIHCVENIDRIMDGLFELRTTDFDKSLEATEPDIDQILIPASFRQTRQLTDQQKRNVYRDWQNNKDQHYVNGRDYLLGTILSGSGITVTSIGRNIAKPRLELTFHGCEAFNARDPSTPRLDKIVPPVLRQTGPLGLSAEDFYFDYTPAIDEADWENRNQDAVVIMTPDSFRPDTPWRNDAFEIVLLARDPDAESVSVSWKLTEENSDQVTSGKFTIPTSTRTDGLSLFKRVFLEPMANQ